MICDNVLKYVLIGEDNSITEVYHETNNNEPARVIRDANDNPFIASLNGFKVAQEI